jgi:hypothetical protein
LLVKRKEELAGVHRLYSHASLDTETLNKAR